MAPRDDEPKKKQPQQWTAEEKLKIVLEAATLTDGELGVFLWNQGIHEAVLAEWKDQALAGLRGTSHTSGPSRAITAALQSRTDCP